MALRRGPGPIRALDGTVGAGRRHQEPRPWAVLGVLCVSLLVVSVDNTILNVALPVLARDLGATSTQLQWIVDAYAVTFGGLLLVAGTMGDRFGRRTTLLVGLVIFGAGSAASAFAGSAGVLVATRALMGVGGALVMPSTLSILTAVFPEPRGRARAIGVWSGTTGLGVAAGPLSGGWLLAHFWWGSVFLVNVPVVVVGLAAVALLVPDSRDPAASPSDPAGAVLSVLGIGAALWAAIEVPVRGWRSPLVVAAAGAAAALLAAFVAWERRSPHPMLRLSYFSQRRFSAAVTSVALAVLALSGVLFVLTQYLQLVLGYSPERAGLRIAPIALVVSVVAPLSVLAARRIGTRLVVAGGLACVAGGLAQLSTTTLHDGFAHAVPGMVLLGVGAGLVLAPATASVMGSVPPEQAGVGSATNSTFLQLGGAFGVAVLGSTLAGRYQGRLLPLLAGQVVPGWVRVLILGSLAGALGVAHHIGGPLGAALAARAKEGFVSGMDVALEAGAVIAVFGVVLALVLFPRAATSRTPGAFADPGRAPRTVSPGARALAVRSSRDPVTPPGGRASARHGSWRPVPPGWVRPARIESWRPASRSRGRKGAGQAPAHSPGPTSAT